MTLRCAAWATGLCRHTCVTPHTVGFRPVDCGGLSPPGHNTVLGVQGVWWASGQWVVEGSRPRVTHHTG
jgi:hypothetical protein